MQNAEGLSLNMQKSQEVFDDLVMRYSEPHRAHHSLYHITEMLGDLISKSTNLPDDVRAQIHGHGSTLFFAIFLHDAVYQPKAQDNEYQSMAYARDALAAMGVTQPTIEETTYLISTTNYFEVEPNVFEGHPLAAVLRDLDFGVLAKDKQRVFDYDADIRLEFSNLSDKAFALGRLYYLRKYFSSPLFYSQLYTPEEQYRAKKNIALLLIERYNTLGFRNVEDTLP
jgi:predicted metal-dependent HD superfamily phosphohydrolase